MRRSAPTHEHGIYRIGNNLFDLVHEQLERDNKLIKLTNKKKAAFTVSLPTQANIDAKGISHAINGNEHQLLNRSIDMTINRLRKKLGEDTASPRHLCTVGEKGLPPHPSTMTIPASLETLLENILGPENTQCFLTFAQPTIQHISTNSPPACNNRIGKRISPTPLQGYCPPLYSTATLQHQLEGIIAKDIATLQHTDFLPQPFMTESQHIERDINIF